MRIRCGDPRRFVGDYPRPYWAVLGPRFTTTFVKKTQEATHLANKGKDESDSGEGEKSREPEIPTKEVNPITPEEEKAGNDWCKLRGAFINRKVSVSLIRLSAIVNTP